MPAGQPTGYFNQTYAVEFEVSGSLDGTTVQPEILDSPPIGLNANDPQNLFRIQAENLGLIDPDYLVPADEEDRRGTRGNRFVAFIWISGPNNGDANASVDIVDAVGSGTPVDQKPIGTFVGAPKFYEERIFVPQGSMIRVRGLTANPGDPIRVRLHIQYIDDTLALIEAVNPVNPSFQEGSPTFVYRPGGADGENVYSDFSELALATQAQEGPKWIEVDDSIVAIPLIPAGIFDLNGSIIQGRPEVAQTILRGSVGSRLLNVGGIQQNLQLQNNDPAQALIEMNALEYFDVRDGASLASLVAAPVVEWAGAGAVVLRLQEGRLRDLGFGPAFGVTGGAGCTASLETYDGSIVDDDTLEIAAGSTVTVRVRDLGSDVSRTHAAVAGTLAFGDTIMSASVQPKDDSLLDVGFTSIVPGSSKRLRQLHNRMDIRVGSFPTFYQNVTTLTYNPDALGTIEVLTAGYATGLVEIVGPPHYGNLNSIRGRISNWDAGASVSKTYSYATAFLHCGIYVYGGAGVGEVAINNGYMSMLGGTVFAIGGASGYVSHETGAQAAFSWVRSWASGAVYGTPIVRVSGESNLTVASSIDEARIYNRHGYSTILGVCYGLLPQYAVMENVQGALGAFIQGRCQATTGYNGYMRVEDDAGWATGRTNSGRIETRAGQAAWARGFAQANGTIYAQGHAASAWGYAKAGETIGVAANNAEQWGVGVNTLADSARFGVGWRFKKTVGAPGVPANGDAWVGAGGSMYVHTNGVTKNLDLV